MTSWPRRVVAQALAPHRGYERAPWHVLVLDQATRYDVSMRAGTEYDLRRACPKCGTGAEVLGPLHLTGGKLPRKFAAFFTDYSHLIVRRDLVDKVPWLQATRHDVLHDVSISGQLIKDWVEMRPQVLLPRMSEASGIARERVCPVCERDGLFVGRRHQYRPRYDCRLPDGSPPFVAATFEVLGNSRVRSPFEDSRFQRPLLVFSAAAREQLDAAGFDAQWHPVEHLPNGAPCDLTKPS